MNLALDGALALKQSQDVDRNVAMRTEDGTVPGSARQVECAQIGAFREVLVQLDLDAEGGRQWLHRFDAAEVGTGQDPERAQRRQLTGQGGRLPAAPARERALEVVAPPLAWVAGVGVPD